MIRGSPSDVARGTIGSEHLQEWMDMAGPIDGLMKRLSSLGGMRRGSASPMTTLGTGNTAVYAGYPDSAEDSADLKGRKKYETYGEMLANTSIVASGVRYFLNLTAKAAWSFEPGEGDTDGRYAELAEQLLTDDPKTPWHRIVRRAAMYRFYGFSVQEWTARRRDDGIITLKDVAPRAQRTIERWDVAEDGEVLGMTQRSPQSQREIYLPREKVLYMVDDTLDDGPEGLGLFRHLARPSKALRRYEQLEGVGFETDLRGIPIARGPFTELQAMVEAGEITEAQRIQIEKPIRDFMENHVKSKNLGLLLDSKMYETADDARRPSGNPQWDVELLKAASSSMPELQATIQRCNREIARVLGVEQLLLGEDSAGSFALSKDKTQSFFLLVDGTLTELVEGVSDDLLKTLWRLNGWPEETMPTLGKEAVRFQDVEEITAALRDMAQAGAVLDPDDPAIGEVRDLLGLSRPETGSFEAEDAALGGNSIEGSTDDPDEEMPDDGTQED